MKESTKPSNDRRRSETLLGRMDGIYSGIAKLDTSLRELQRNLKENLESVQLGEEMLRPILATARIRYSMIDTYLKIDENNEAGNKFDHEPDNIEFPGKINPRLIFGWRPKSATRDSDTLSQTRSPLIYGINSQTSLHMSSPVASNHLAAQEKCLYPSQRQNILGTDSEAVSTAWECSHLFCIFLQPLSLLKVPLTFNLTYEPGAH